MPLRINHVQLNGTEVHLWEVDLSTAGDARMLAPDERARADRLLIPDKRQQFIAARAGLRHILSEYTGSPPETLILGTRTHGKPFICDDSGWEFNLAHSDDTALVAVALRPVGIDLERERPLSGLQLMAQIAFSPQEQADLSELSTEYRSRAFFRTWTRKEALLKGHGAGFRLAHTFSLPVTEQPQTITVGHWMIADIEMRPGFVAALAVDGPL
jgi:4'-phosphopantetheinyl transferase